MEKRVKVQKLLKVVNIMENEEIKRHPHDLKKI